MLATSYFSHSMVCQPRSSQLAALDTSLSSSAHVAASPPAMHWLAAKSKKANH
jgi:hypothetical protein